MRSSGGMVDSGRSQSREVWPVDVEVAARQFYLRVTPVSSVHGCQF